MSAKLRHLEGENGYSANIGISKLEGVLSCACRCLALGVILAQPGEGLDHPIAFSRKKLSSADRNYTTTEREGLVIVYALQKIRHYLLGAHFKMFTNHSALKYLVNKPVLGGRIYRWLLLFQEYDFEIIVKPGRLNAGPDHLSRLESGEEPTSLEDNLP